MKAEIKTDLPKHKVDVYWEDGALTVFCPLCGLYKQEQDGQLITIRKGDPNALHSGNSLPAGDELPSLS